MMDKIRSIQVFIAVADCHGFASAARRLNMSPPAVTRSISMLEDHLGARLFIRTTRSVRLTDVGKRFLENSRRILLELDEAEQAGGWLACRTKGGVEYYGFGVAWPYVHNANTW